MNVGLWLERRGKLFWWVVGIGLIFIVGLVDYLTGYEMNFSLFYIVPIFLAAWYASGKAGVVISTLSAFALFVADLLSGLVYSHASIYVWNTILLAAFFFIVALLAAALRKSYRANQDLARIDYVTGAVSIRFFYDLAKVEIGRSARYKRPFTLAYFDLDNFKSINDTLGHSTGDRVLREVAETIRRHIRKSDTFARLGGDEFALLLPETAEMEAQTMIARLQTDLAAELARKGWQVTFSVGVVTYKEPPANVDDMVKLADDLMYTVKTNTKNGVAYQLYAG
jgi:diguanylate cyclase (GGDEF)-like protein